MTSPTALVIDCDPGIDDALALMLAAAAPQLDLRAVTCVAGNRPVPVTAANARKILDVVDLDAVPVYAGAARPLAYPEPRCNEVHGLDGLGGARLAGRNAIAAGHAADVIVDLLASEPSGSLTLVAIGPLTNLALAEIKAPGVLRRARQVAVMGGAAFVPGNVTPAAEFNFYADALAAHVVVTSGAKPLVFGLDVTRKVAMSPQWIESVARRGSRAGEAAGAMLQAYAAHPLLHDACPIAWLIDPTLFTLQEFALGIEWREGSAEGNSRAFPPPPTGGPNAPNVLLATEVDAPRLLDMVRVHLDTLA
jgi:purine nucleosidase